MINMPFNPKLYNMNLEDQVTTIKADCNKI